MDHKLLWTIIAQSLLCVFSKILEKIMLNRLSTFLENNNILCPEQFGFRKSHSTIHPLTLFINQISESLNKKEHAIAIFCDLKKAFDTVDFEILLTKLHNIGVRGTELLWFQDYLCNRKQYVSIIMEPTVTFVKFFLVYHKAQFWDPSFS